MTVYFTKIDDLIFFQFNMEMTCSTFFYQVYSNTRVPTQVNTNQHESDTRQHESDTSQHKSTQVKTCSRWVNMNQYKSDTSLTQVNLS